jgi:(E)-4-hydroxy-3-methylbut-2-enyl-diphosphate synthase
MAIQPPARRQTRQVTLGELKIGGGAPVAVQSMTNTDTRDVGTTLAQIDRLAQAGCDAVRLAVLDEDAAKALKEIRDNTKVPLIADIHFDHRLALAALEAGIDGLRINPGNIGARWKVEEVVRAAKDCGAPIRIGVNSGSLDRELLEKYGSPTAEALVESALKHVTILEELGFDDIKLSLKGSDVPRTVEAYQRMIEVRDYPLHIGITEAGTVFRGAVKSAVGLGILLADGIGDTLRVSLSGDPVREIEVCYWILSSLGIRRRGIDVISCPTCGRTRMGVEMLALEIEKRLADLDAPITLAVMGCEVNGPGEAREADLGVAAGKTSGLLFKDGKVIRKVPHDRIADEVEAEARKLAAEINSKNNSDK